MSPKIDVRKKADWQEPRAIPERQLREAFNYRVGKIDKNFCENKLWWWRALLKCLDGDFKKTGNYLVSKDRMGFFSPVVFETLQAHADAGEMHSLLHLWRVTEIGERIEELVLDDFLGPAWPAY